MNGISNNFTNRMRFTGLSGLDTESIIEQLMQAEKMPLNGLYQKRTLVEWKRDAYRDVTTSLKGFKSTYFDIVNRSSYILSKNSVKTMAAQSSRSEYLDVSASSDAQAGITNVKVLQVATADAAVTPEGSRVSSNITGTVNNLNLTGKRIKVTLDGISKEITLENYSPVPTSDIAAKLKASLDATFGTGKITVDFDQATSKLSVGTTGGATKITFSDPTGHHSVDNPISGLEGLGIVSGSSNRISLNQTLGDLKNLFQIPLEFSVNNTVEFTINGKLIRAEASETLAQVFEKINNTPEANATVRYDELTDRITLASKQYGFGDNLTLSDINGSFLKSMGIVDATNTIRSMTEGQDAKIMINGNQEIVRSTNNFTVNGITYTLKTKHPDADNGDTITVSHDTDTAFNNIKSFVEKYNELIDKLNDKIGEKYDRNYLPLTDEQKEAMKEEDVKKWEEKAKTGLLRNDSVLQEIVTDMRTALYEKVEGVNLTLKDIGIESKSYLDRGKLYIDENKLKAVLKNQPDEVAKLLNGVDPNNPAYSRTATSGQRLSRYEHSGVFQRLSDIIEDNISSMRDANDKKGILLEKAGITGDASVTENLLYDELERYDKKIDTFIDRLVRKEENYYKQFSKLEAMLNQMNAQSSWIASQFSAGQ